MDYRWGDIVEFDAHDGTKQGKLTGRQGREPYFVYQVNAGMGANYLIPSAT